LNRDAMLARLLDSGEVWDVLVIGGGATGLGAAVDAAARGYRTALVEGEDFAKGSSSRSTKLIHGGVRYLQQGHLPLVFEALRERGLLLRNAPHLVRELSFVVPGYDWWEGPFYGLGLKLYDFLAGGGLGPSHRLSREETLERLPTLEPAGLRGGISYQDAQFDDARLALALARTAADLGAVVVNHLPVVALVKEGDRLRGVRVRDAETGEEHEVRARGVLNATGVFADGVRGLDDPGAEPVLAPSQGVHLVLDRRFQPGESALLVPHTDDGRVLFAVPWHDRVVVGTTDTPVSGPALEPRPLPEEVEFLLGHARGKWTTYRRMGEDAIDEVARVAGLDERPSRTAELPLHDSDVPELIRLAAERPGWAEPLHLDLPYRVCDVVHAARHEMARTVEDVLARRTRALLLDARASEEAAPAVAALLAAELGRDESWQREQVAAYRELARGYRL
jgi:glycerol-3-phosphate dehydrogenase